MSVRSVLGAIAGLVASVVIVLVVESIGHLLFPPPPGMDLSNPAALATLISQLPFGALAFVMLAWIAGAFGGGAVAAWIARRSWPAWVVGVLMLAGGVWSMIVIPHPVWMQVGLVPATLLPAWLAGQIWSTPRRRGALPGPPG
ncbi:MAG: hypothetical protein U1E49_02035 [Hyphomicrobiaceae bacterium]